MGVLFPFAPVGSQVPGLRVIQIVLCLKVSGVIFFGTRNCQKVSKQQEPKPMTNGHDEWKRVLGPILSLKNWETKHAKTSEVGQLR